MATLEENQRAVEQRREEVRKAREEHKKETEKLFDESRAEQERQVQEVYSRYGKPTPTPKEIALAAAGHHVDNKEPDGSPEQDPRAPIPSIVKALEVKPGQARQGYQTRAQQPAKKE
jgi:hypothetical protein